MAGQHKHRAVDLPPGYAAGGFFCEPPGEPDPIGEFLRDGHAARHQAAGVSRTYLVIEYDAPWPADATRPVAFFSLHADALVLAEEDPMNGLGIRSIPAIKVSRLGVRHDQRRNGLGHDALLAIQDVAISIGNMIGVRYLTLDAVADKVGWYERQGFKVTLSEQPTSEPGLESGDRSMWLDLGDLSIREAVEPSAPASP